MNQSNPIIKLKNLSKSFNAKSVLKKINLEVYKGDSLVIIGASGEGKSVLLKCILGLLPVDSGSEIEIFGVNNKNCNAKDLAKVRSKISMLFQGSALFDSISVWENIYFRSIQAGIMSRNLAKEIVKDILMQVGLDKDVAHLFPAELSGGMKRRVALARAIASDPEIIFFDEPTAGLDPITANVIDSLITKTIKDLNITAVTITHEMNSVDRIADEVAMLHKGRIIWQGSKNELKDTHNLFVQQFIHGNLKGPLTIVIK